jgi:hypothetical protein
VAWLKESKESLRSLKAEVADEWRRREAEYVALQEEVDRKHS